jgi:diguanylate cyclase (GGDEF)-like protein/PAS domain S-box-containing protein
MSIVLVVSAAVVTAAHWFVEPPLQALLSVLLFALVLLTILSQHSALELTLHSLQIAHYEQVESERRYRTLFDGCSDIILAYPIEGGGRCGPFVEVNDTACRAFGYSREALMQLTMERFCSPDLRSELQGRNEAVSQVGSTVFETALVTRAGPLPVEVSARIVEMRGRSLCLAVIRDVALRKEREDRLQGISMRDDLTGLLNRRGFLMRLDKIALIAGQRGANILIVYIDVDGLKRVNDLMGHAAGDVVLLAAAEVLRLTFREDDLVARMGGDEFVAMAVLGHPDDERLDQDTIMNRFEGLIAAKRAELGEEYQFSLSCGMAVVGQEEVGRIDELLARADKRMYEAKRTRKSVAAC